VADGDTLTIGDTHIRLEGIDAPETDQVCLDAKGERWTCGILARDRLAEHIGARGIFCAKTGTDRYRRVLAVCSVAGEDLNAWMVSQGLALAYIQFSKAYVAEEASAREAQRGMWSGAFVAPWEWRNRNERTVIRGALAVPTNAKEILLAPASSAGAPSPQCIIKGNANSKGERIYHMPGQTNYGSINMAKPGKRWFCTEDDAQAAGWRKAAR
jgi:nuclease-like protein